MTWSPILMIGQWALKMPINGFQMGQSQLLAYCFVNAGFDCYLLIVQQ